MLKTLKATLIQTQGFTEQPYQALHPLLFPKAWHHSASLAAADVVPDLSVHGGPVDTRPR